MHFTAHTATKQHKAKQNDATQQQTLQTRHFITKPHIAITTRGQQHNNKKQNIATKRETQHEIQQNTATHSNNTNSNYANHNRTKWDEH